MIFRELIRWRKQDKYLHWDDLRRRPAPAGFSHEEWWLGLKFHRQGNLRDIALNDKKGRPFRFGLTDALNELLHQIDRGLA